MSSIFILCASISFTCVASAHTYHVGTIITNVLIQFNFVLQLAKENGSDPVCQFWNFTEDSKYTGHQMSDISMALLLHMNLSQSMRLALCIIIQSTYQDNAQY